MATISLRNVCKSYGRTRIIEDLALEVRDREFLVLLGPSGCGKSTLLRMIAGLEAPSAGDLLMDGRVINDLPARQRDVAMVFQNYALYPHMTVAENMALALRLRRQPAAEIQRKVREAAEILAIGHLLERRPRQLSGGQRQRVAMGRAIVRNPRVFLFDEPLSNLDAELRLRMRTEIKQLHARLGATMVYVTHDQIEAMTLADRIVIMRAGLIQQIGTPYEVFSTPANLFVASFIGSPPMNLLCAELAGDRLLVPGWGASLPFPAGRFRRADGRALVLGIRPDHLAPVTSADGCALTLHGEVRVIEPLGADMLVFLAVAGEDRGPDSQMVSFKCPYSERLRPGQALTLGCQTAHLHLFDQDSQASLRLPVA